MLPLLLPWIAIALVLAAFILLLCKKWRIGVLLIVLAIVVNWWSECIPFRLWPICEKAGFRSISVFAFNINTTSGYISEKVNKLVCIIEKNNPDVIYFSELSTPNRLFLDTSLSKDYPYTLFGHFHVFYSKYPLVERMMSGKEDILNGDVIKCQTIVGNDTIAFRGCHLASNNYTVESKYITPDSINSCNAFIQYVNDINLASSQREKEVDELAREVSQMKKPVIVLGDMNDVGGSKSIRQLEKSGLKDAWWEGGFGYGATIHKPLPYRIDHILYSSHFKLNNVRVISSKGLSDHDAVFAEFSY